MKTRKRMISSLFTLMLLLGGSERVLSQTEADLKVHLDLHAVGELFKRSETVEAFERSLNDAEVGVNNLDLDRDGEVDIISVSEMVSGDTHLLILRVPLAEDEVQDVATIAVEKKTADLYDLEIHGNAYIYGANYYIVPTTVNLTGWRIFNWLYRPGYRPYTTVFGYKIYPRWWKPRPVVAINVYRARTVGFVGRTFVVANRGRVRSVTKIRYTPRASSRVVVTKKVVRPKKKTVVVRKTRRN